jgi:hypothetical protein
MSAIVSLCALMISLATFGDAMAQAPATSQKAVAAPEFALLKGAWVRPDGGYMIAVNGIAPDGRLDAIYFNPKQLPFARAQASRDGGALRVSLELTAGGYAGSTYELTYDPASDRLKGTYYQAVAKQKFDVYFARK